MLRYAGAAVPFLFNTGLQVSGFNNTATTVVCWTLVAIILVWAGIHTVREWHANRLKAGLLGVQTWHFILAGIIGTWIFLSIALGSAAVLLFKNNSNAEQASTGTVITGSPPSGANTPAPNLTTQADEGPLVWFAQIFMEGGPPSGVNIFSLRFKGINTSQSEVKLKKASIISGVNGTKLDLEVAAGTEIVPVDQIELIPVSAPIELVAKFGPADPNSPGKIMGLEPKTFLETWRQFSLNIEDGSRTYRVPFTENNLAPFFPGIVGPHVTKKAKSDAANK